jgi:4-hydroxyphenylpyruvate dioxygenase
MHDFCPIKRIDHLEFFVANARQAAFFYRNCLGFTNTAYRGLETGSRTTCSYLMEQGDIRFVLTSALVPTHPIAQFVHEHGDGVGVIALEVPDAAAAFRETTTRGALPALEPAERGDTGGTLVESAIHAYGDAVIRFVDRSSYRDGFWPGFRATGVAVSQADSVGLDVIDHIVGNVELGAMDRWVRFFAETMGFSQLVHFDDKTITTEYSALMSKVMQDGTGRIKFPINEPATGKRKSQIQEYLDYYRGPGVQHVALATTDIIDTVYNLKSRGLEFLRVPSTYYEDLAARIGPIEQPIDKLAELGILADRDEEGYLLQIFTEVVEDRPTLFFEVIERHGSRGFGEGNFKSLFEAIEREQARRGNLV